MHLELQSPLIEILQIFTETFLDLFALILFFYSAKYPTGMAQNILQLY